jgi:drug/metabolite transporter (DMT)-like permease
MPNSGIISGLLVGFFSAWMTYFVKNPGESLSSPKLLAFRMFWTSAFLLPFVWRELPKVLTGEAKNLWLRALFGAGGALCFFYTIHETTMGMATLLWSFSPVFVVLVSTFFLSERLNIYQWAGVGLITTSFYTISGQEMIPVRLSVSIVGICGAVFACFAYISLKRVPKSFSPLVIVFVFCLASCLVSLSIVREVAFLWQGLSRWELWGILITSFLMQFFLTLTYQKLDASVAAMLTQSTIVFVTVLDVWLLDLHLSAFAYLLLFLFCAGLVLVQWPSKATQHRTNGTRVKAAEPER